MEASLGLDEIDEWNSLTIQNKDKSFVGVIDKELNEELYGDIVDAIKASGWKGFKVFFYVIVDKSSDKDKTIKIKINPSRVLPVKSW